MLRTKMYRAFSLVLAGLLFLCGCTEATVEDGLLADDISSPADVNYNTTAVVRSDYEAASTGTASLAYMVKTSLYWDQGEARYQETLVKAGQKVAAGDVLMTFDVSVKASEVAELEIRLKREKQDYASGVEKYQAAIAQEKERAKTLSAYDLEISEYTTQKLQAQYEQFVYQSEYDIASLRKQIDLLKAEAENNSLCAPFDGVIDSVIRNNEGDRVSTTKPLVVMHSEDVVLLNVKSGANELRYNMPVTIEYGSNANKKTYTGRVVSAPNILPSDVDYDNVMIMLDQPLSGESSRGNFKLSFISKEISNILITDRKAVSGANAESYVYVLENDTLHKRFVVTKRDGGQTVWILDGLSEGQTLVLD